MNLIVILLPIYFSMRKMPSELYGFVCQAPLDASVPNQAVDITTILPPFTLRCPDNTIEVSDT